MVIVMEMTEETWKEAFKVKYKKFSRDAKDAAAGWTCCAIGCKIARENPDLDIDNISYKKLLTPKAYRLGRKFMDHVDNNNVTKAEKVYNQVQALDNIFRIEGKTYFPWDAYI